MSDQENPEDEVLADNSLHLDRLSQLTREILSSARRMRERLAVGTAEDAWELAMHLIGRHADPMAVCRSYADNADQHHCEHQGPGTIRNHSPASRVFDPAKVEAVLEECEAEL
jgi:hypothetical protein